MYGQDKNKTYATKPSNKAACCLACTTISGARFFNSSNPDNAVAASSANQQPNSNGKRHVSCRLDRGEG